MANQWVAIRPSEPENAAASVSFQLPHPRTGESSRYVLQENEVLLEVQKVEPEHKSSWFIGNSVQRDGVLYVMTPIDPLFILLPVLDQIRRKTPESEGRFVQYDDIFSGADHGDDGQRYKSLRRLPAVSKLSQQLAHLCDKQEYIQGEFSYRLNEDKTLQWLRLKVQSVANNIDKMPILLTFIKEQLFDINVHETDERIRNEAYTWVGIQMISEYLTTWWQERLTKSYSLINLEKQVEEYKKNQEMEFQNYCTSNPAEYAKAKREATDISEQNSKKFKLTAGQKTLAKANIKGMKSLTSFFAKKEK